MTDRISSTWRGRPAPLRPPWRLPAVSRRWRVLLAVLAPVAVFGAASWWLGEFLAALLVTCAVSTLALLGWLVVFLPRHVEREVDEVRAHADEVGRRVTRDALRWRELDAATADVARLSSRVRFLEEMRLGEPQETGRDDRRTG